MDRIADAAALLAACRLAGQPVDVLPVMVRPRDEAEAYWVQSAVHKLIARSRYGSLIGHRVNCTAPVTQRYFGIKRPASGGVFSGTVHPSGIQLHHGRFLRMGAECEIAVRLARDLPSDGGPYDQTNVADAVEAWMPVIAVVDDRYVDWRRTDTPTLIADDFFSAATVIGKAIPAAEAGDPAEFIGIASVNGAEIGRGRGTDLMGHPLNVLAWLANSLLARGEALRAGETVLLGSLVQTRWLNRNDHVAFEVSGLGSVELGAA
jgi:2-oxo-3-hexenedioate decarboxylase/2-keto-4-pentenoate hydratase